RPPLSPLFPYTTLFRSWPIAQWYPQSLVFATGDLLFAWPAPSGEAPPGWWSALILPVRYEPFVEACTVSLAVVAIGSIAREVFRSEEHTSELQSRENLV